MKAIAPTRPHPSAPDTPPLNKILAPGAGLVDRIRDKITGRGKEERRRVGRDERPEEQPDVHGGTLTGGAAALRWRRSARTGACGRT